MESVNAALGNIAERQKQDIADSLPDDQQYLEDWRRGLEAALKEGVAKSLEFLLTSPSPDQSELQKELLGLIRRFSRPHRISSTEVLAPPPSPDTIRSDIESVIGFSISEHLSRQKQLMSQYISTVVSLSSAEQKLTQKMEQLTKIHDAVVRLQALELPAAGLDTIRGPVEQYLSEVFDNVNLSECYAALLREYGRFLILREVVIRDTAAEPRAHPTCTICTTNEISHAVTPCGHTFCSDCCKQQMTSCYICRTQIRDRLRFYFS